MGDMASALPPSTRLRRESSRSRQDPCSHQGQRLRAGSSIRTIDAPLALDLVVFTMGVLGFAILAGLPAVVSFVSTATDSIPLGRFAAESLQWLTIPGTVGLVAAAGDGDVEALIEGVKRVADGEYDVAFDLDREDELGQLARELDDMTDAVEEREAALEREIGFTDDVLDALDDVFYVLAPAGEFREWNQTLPAVTGYDPEEVASMRPLDFFEDDDVDTIAEAIDEAFETGTVHVEADLQTKNDESIPYEWVATRLDAPDGTPVVAGIGRDRSERTQHERELRQNHRRFEAVFNDPNLLAAIVGPDGRVVTVNEQALSKIDAEQSAVVGEPFWETPWWNGDEALQDEIRDGIDRALDGEYVEYEAEHTGPGVEEYTSAGTIRPVFDDGEVSSLIVSSRDVTERIASERELREREQALQRYREYTDAIIDSMDDLIYVVGTDFRLRRWNRPLTEQTGYDDDEIGRMHPSEFVVDEDVEQIVGAVQETFETGSARAEARILTKDGEAIPYEFLGSLLEDPEGEQVLVGVGRDVSERVERERELQRTKYLLGQAQQIAHVGGWELDVRTEPYTFEATDEFYAIHGVPPDETVDFENVLDLYHPDDWDRIQRLMTDAIEDGAAYDMEVRLSPNGGNDRWVRAIAEPVIEDGDVVALRGSVQAITDRKEQELRLQALHDVARGLLEADATSAIADLVLDAAVRVLGLPCVAIYLVDEDAGRLEPAALSPEFRSVCQDPDAGYAAESGSVLWTAYVGGEVMSVDESDFEGSPMIVGDAKNGLIVPIGEHGVLLAASGQDSVDADDRRVAETLVAAMEAALSRLDTEAALRENQTQLEAQNRRLRRQIQITEIIRRIDRSLVVASTRDEIESAVCERLVESDDVRFAWIGAFDDQNTSLVPQSWAGEGNEYLDAISLSVEEPAPDPAVRVAATGESAVVGSVVESVTAEQWRKHALVWEFSSALAVPLELDEYSYGVLAVYAAEPGAFGELERTVFEELGESIANAISAVEARRALYADEFVELRLRLDGDEEFLGRVAAESGATVDYVGLATHADEESRLFFETRDAEPAAVQTVLDSLHAVTTYRRIGESGGSTLFEATVVGTVLAARLVNRGGVPRGMTATATDVDVVVDVPTATDVREFVDTLRERYPSIELLGRRNVSRDVQTRQELVAGLFDELTERQLEVLRTAFYAGFFEWPRESTGEDVADLLDVSQPTVNRHLRHGMARLLAQLFEEEPTAVAPA